MHWIVQSNAFNAFQLQEYTDALERLGITYTLHKVVPFSGELIPPAEPTQEHVMCWGAYSMRHTAKAMGWTPGSFDLFDQNFNVQLEHWGTRLLNHDSVVQPFKDTVLIEPRFVRPIDDSKYFTGAVFEPEEFNEWRHKIVKLKEDYGNLLTGDTLIQICGYKLIYVEYRFWVVDGLIVTKSMYRRGGQVHYSNQVDCMFDEFVKACISIWEPARAFVIDVCDTPDGLKIVEINTLNAAGTYAANVPDLFAAIDLMPFAS
jgi:hypothetical protein